MDDDGDDEGDEEKLLYTVDSYDDNGDMKDGQFCYPHEVCVPVASSPSEQEREASNQALSSPTHSFVIEEDYESEARIFTGEGAQFQKQIPEGEKLSLDFSDAKEYEHAMLDDINHDLLCSAANLSVCDQPNYVVNTIGLSSKTTAPDDHATYRMVRNQCVVFATSGFIFFSHYDWRCNFNILSWKKPAPSVTVFS